MKKSSGNEDGNKTAQQPEMLQGDSSLGGKINKNQLKNQLEIWNKTLLASKGILWGFS